MAEDLFKATDHNRLVKTGDSATRATTLLSHREEDHIFQLPELCRWNRWE